MEVRAKCYLAWYFRTMQNDRMTILLYGYLQKYDDQESLQKHSPYLQPPMLSTSHIISSYLRSTLQRKRLLR